jgi:hypothetical protein
VTTQDKKEFLKFIDEKHLTMIFEHDPIYYGSTVKKDEKGNYVKLGQEEDGGEEKSEKEPETGSSLGDASYQTQVDKEKETSEKPILTKAIKTIANENIKQIKNWKEKHPDCTDADSKKNNMWLKIVSNSMNGLTEEEGTKNINKIISNVAKEVTIIK